MKKQKPLEPKLEAMPNPYKLGAQKCPKCHTEDHMVIVSKTLGRGATFVEITCNLCMRTAISEVESNIGPAIRGCIARWNSIWPDVSEFIDGPSEGTKWLV